MYSYISFGSFTVAPVRLIIRLWRDTELASQVRRLDLSWTGFDSGEYPFDGFFEDDEALGFIETALDEIFTPEERDMRDMCDDDEGLCPEAWMGLLLVRMTHLQTLGFGHDTSHLISDILRKAAKREQPFNQETPFPHLEEVRGYVECEPSWISSDFLQPFFYFPAVRRIHGAGIGDFENEGSKASYVRQPSCPVQEISVDKDYWCRGMLDWLAACRRLEHINIGVEMHPDEYDIAWELKFNASRFCRALLPFNPTLRSLCIRYGDSYEDYMRERDANDDVFGSFKEFSVLHHLTVRHAHLIGLPFHHLDMKWDRDRQSLVEILPNSLKSLYRLVT
ncbi:uncharacterized protein N7469_002126 [Penicillium citrinum]|uniref:Leucine-rich repeat domain-containing protein n=1 Tax=Penicillium citrinum TaxID=5077 RepID=A0A9W9TT76_PENCI|nr:uncharacterized protein N7469_002126 [Penicillium citrinum]KAJ5240535.1 hypothetical protein N7469_002126 [Penicillium citrinum]